MAKFICNMVSYTLKRSIDLTIIIPTPTISDILDLGGMQISHRLEEKYPILYLLHGLGNNHASWTAYSNVELYAEERNIAVVMVSTENKAYVNQKGNDKFYDFLALELPEFVCNMFPISNNPKHTYIAGISMGGYGTLVHALSRPDQFAAFGSFSGTISWGQEETEQKKIEEQILSPLVLANQIVAYGRTFPKAYIACGEDDFLYDANIKFKDKLTQLGVDVTWSSVPGYGHEWRFWDKQIELFLDWLPRTDNYSKVGLRKI